jgi:hypothetical protein
MIHKSLLVALLAEVAVRVDLAAEQSVREGTLPGAMVSSWVNLIESALGCDEEDLDADGVRLAAALDLILRTAAEHEGHLCIA